MIYTISRPPNDGFSYPLFTELLKNTTADYNAYYIWSNPPETLTKLLNRIDFSLKPNVILGIKDLLDMWQDYNYWKQTANAGTELIDSVAQKYPNTNFILLTSMENLQFEHFKSTNIQIVPWGGDCVNQSDRYQSLIPVLDKNFETNRHVISLNRNLRDHRIVYLCYLFGSMLHTNVDVSCLGLYNLNSALEPTEFLDRIFWRFDVSDEHNRIREILINGYKKFFNNQTLVSDDYKIYESTSPNDNWSNFNNNLRFKYQNSFVEVVTESSFSSPGYMLTEKTMHSFYACNFPIILAGSGAVQHLRDIGFDMFDDVVNHSYDQIKNPIDRIAQAVELNRQLFVDGDYVKTKWANNRSRFEKNVEVAKNITDYYRQRTTQLWNQLIWK